MAVTIKDVAQRVGKSVTTVSRALHGYDDVSEETRTLVEKVAEEMGYRPNTLAQRLQKRTTDTLGLVLPTFGPRFSDPFFSEFLAGIGNKAADFGYDLLVSTQPPGEREMHAYKQAVESRRVDGFVVVRTRMNDERINYLRGIDFPFVAFGRTHGELDFPFVDEDSQHGMRLMAQHIIQQGFHRVACIAPEPDLMFAKYRLDGFREGLAEAGGSLEDRYLKYSDLTQRGGYEKANELLAMDEPPTAIAACNDLMAFGAIRAAHEQGLAIGEEIAITGFDDIPMSEHFHPPLTTVNQPIYEIGGRVCEMLIHHIQGKPLEEEQVILKPSLVLRESTGVETEEDI
ncbi:MAG: LacI family transcriptional regulator [Chloroflexi bacterium]|nr:MAG: LacI family transcriptional regulator [Chloroflexota bacterium]MBL1195465.1 LacI family transcriptional regulator [Chloroflexota bacterium]NOH12748.1 LacI family DNA-binding transcriptional regulator [Chloroflexota bacterium]